MSRTHRLSWRCMLMLVTVRRAAVKNTYDNRVEAIPGNSPDTKHRQPAYCRQLFECQFSNLWLAVPGARMVNPLTVSTLFHYLNWGRNAPYRDSLCKGAAPIIVCLCIPVPTPYLTNGGAPDTSPVGKRRMVLSLSYYSTSFSII